MSNIYKIALLLIITVIFICPQLHAKYNPAFGNYQNNFQLNIYKNFTEHSVKGLYYTSIMYQQANIFLKLPARASLELGMQDGFNSSTKQYKRGYLGISEDVILSLPKLEKICLLSVSYLQKAIL